MRTIFVAVLAVIAGAGVVALEVPAISHLFESEEEARQRAFRTSIEGRLRKEDAGMPDGAFVLLGDSMSQGFGSIRSDIADLVNFGIGGDDAIQLRQRLTDYRHLDRSRAILLQIGINDLLKGHTVPATAAAIDALLKDLRGRKVYLNAVFPLNIGTLKGRGATDVTNEKVRQLNSQLLPLCEKHGCTFVPMDAFWDGDDLDRRYDIGDGIHLNEAGYRLWERLILAATAKPAG